VLLAVLVCVVLVSLIALTLIKLTLAQRSQVQRELWRTQADWLAESGLERAAAKLANNVDYAGETWSVSAEQIGGGRGGEVHIKVSPMDGQPQQRRVRVQAIFPAGTDQRASSSKQVTVAVRGVGTKLPANE
jgi:Tfp pilus assembly protein PilV